MADEIWRKITPGTDLPKSVHLSDWPEAHIADAKVLADMQKVRDVITEGLAVRAAQKIKVRQPLASVTVPKLPAVYKDILAEELNVKHVEFGKVLELDTHMTDELKAEGVMRDLVRHIQNLRKTAGLNVDDRIVLHIKTADALVKRAVDNFNDVIKQETLAVELVGDPQDHAADAKIDGMVVRVSLSKA